MKTITVTAVALAALALAVTAPSFASDDGPDARHHVTCKLNKRTGTPWASSATTVMGYVQVLCSDSLDDANTQAQLQIFRGGSRKNHGDGVTSCKTGKTIHVNATAAKRIGNWRYRTRGTNFGQHGNIWTLPTYYSPARMLWRRG
ncbi:hypothetical protein ABZ930_36985 [Streptomyces sp. NPDC046716]|uniref:hypothetical protein n=1 Tax=Streptomyces sp. NPDC046716 TaxID=3157093 RepID=UPI0033D11921